MYFHIVAAAATADVPQRHLQLGLTFDDDGLLHIRSTDLEWTPYAAAVAVAGGVACIADHVPRPNLP